MELFHIEGLRFHKQERSIKWWNIRNVYWRLYGCGKCVF